MSTRRRNYTCREREKWYDQYFRFLCYSFWKVHSSSAPLKLTSNRFLKNNIHMGGKKNTHARAQSDMHTERY